MSERSGSIVWLRAGSCWRVCALSCSMMLVSVSACATAYDKEMDSLAVIAAAQSTPPDTSTRQPVDTAPEKAGTSRDTTAVSPSLGDYVIDPRGIGRIRLGQTLDEARRAAPGAVFGRTSDGDGAILVEVTFGPDTTLVLYADESEAESIAWSKRIEHLETFSAAFQTSEGVRRGSLVSDVEKIYGPVKEITLSEIESRQYVQFERQPEGMTFRIDYTGEFAEGSRRTTKYADGAKIWSIAIH